MGRVIVVIILISLFCFSSLAAGEIEKDILKYKLDRLYFDCGVEALVFENSNFSVIHKKDTIYKGQIEQSSTGISFKSFRPVPASLEKDVTSS